MKVLRHLIFSTDIQASHSNKFFRHITRSRVGIDFILWHEHTVYCTGQNLPEIEVQSRNPVFKRAWQKWKE